jgi:hypothetical protein
MQRLLGAFVAFAHSQLKELGKTPVNSQSLRNPAMISHGRAMPDVFGRGWPICHIQTQ